MKHITLKQFRALDALVQCGSVKAAAERLNVTPPAVTMQLKLLEGMTGVPIYERTADGIRPTDAGNEILTTGRRIDVLLAECEEALEALKGIDGGRVSVGVISTAKYFAPRVLAEFTHEHPNVEMRLAVGNRGETIAGLRDYECDIAIMGRPPKELDVEYEEIGDHPHIIICPPDHRMANGRTIAPAKLADEVFLLREAGSGTRILMSRLFEEMGVSPRSGMEIGSNETIKQAVMAGLGVALLSAHTVAAELQDGRLGIVNVRGFPVIRKWYVVRRANKRLLPAAQALWDFFVASGAQFFPEV